jgi:hypothetical protein
MKRSPIMHPRPAARVPVAKLRAFRNSFRPTIDRAGLRGQTAVAQMAEDMRMFAAVGDCLTETDAGVLGWTRAQVLLLAAPAREYANRAADQ